MLACIEGNNKFLLNFSFYELMRIKNFFLSVDFDICTASATALAAVAIAVEAAVSDI